MKNNNFTKVNFWKKLKSHFEEIKTVHIRDLFEDNNKRFYEYSIVFNEKILVDFSKNRITNRTMKYLINLAKSAQVKNYIKDMFIGKRLNVTESQPVLHTALRKKNKLSIVIGNEDISIKIKKVLNKMKDFSKLLINGQWKGYTNKKITDVVNIGIGGSYLGPSMVIDTLREYRNHLKVHFISNIDSCNVLEVLKSINIETTIFLISSKTFTTEETITNANTVKDFFLNQTKSIDSIHKHFFALTANVKNAIDFGILERNIFEFWSWVGGRYSLWSSVGLSIILAIGFDNFMELLNGASDMDDHFLREDLEKNIPVILALIGVWYNNFFGAETEAILPYSHNMYKFVEYFQQANMESNGKNIDKSGKRVCWQTGPILWGGIGTNSQHAFYQLLHQGTKLVPCDFIFPINKKNQLSNHNLKLASNFLAQTRALAFGSDIKEINNVEKKSKDFISNSCNFQSKFKVFYGNQPSNSIILDCLDPYNLGSLIALYEHKIFVQGVLFNIFSFDQWGVELGKKLASEIEDKLKRSNSDKTFDCSTEGLMSFYKKKVYTDTISKG